MITTKEYVSGCLTANGVTVPFHMPRWMLKGSTLQLVKDAVFDDLLAALDKKD